MHCRHLALVVLLLCGQVSAEDQKSALETEPDGWITLLDTPLQEWKRAPNPFGSQVKEVSPWNLSDDGKVLICAGAGYREGLLYPKEFGDAIFHVEWRFTEPDKKGYNSGAFVRSSLDGEIWHQAQIGANVGNLFGNTLVNGKAQRVSTHRPLLENSRAQPIGEWNRYEITAKGDTLTLWINGAVTAEWKGCEVLRGYFGVEAEGFQTEFRNLKLKEIP
ncbi:3-keto-disaccharide hydrolase [Planctomicrobium sp. SH664]|uniref:3-keto-disaccharide hydrolase n=1 Tax=Planctomicrobium sp. SH664 TaxID=3448125 RepID=UPI003F5C73F6